MPLAIGEPQEVVYSLKVNLPSEEEWQFEAEDHFIEGHGLRFERTVRQHENTVQIDASFRITVDHVEASALTDYLKAAAAIDTMCSYSVWRLKESERTFKKEQSR